MYWSVVGLYAAFAAEILTRIPDTPFLNMVGLAESSSVSTKNAGKRHFANTPKQQPTPGILNPLRAILSTSKRFQYLAGLKYELTSRANSSLALWRGLG
mgnify:CR=1 FL=1